MKHSAIDMYVLSKIIGKKHFNFSDVFFGTSHLSTEETQESISRLERDGFIERSEPHQNNDDEAWVVKKTRKHHPAIGLAILSIAFVTFIVILCLM